jgi:hypothetical protein
MTKTEEDGAEEEDPIELKLIDHNKALHKKLEDVSRVAVKILGKMNEEQKEPRNEAAEMMQLDT